MHYGRRTDLVWSVSSFRRVSISAIELWKFETYFYRLHLALIKLTISLSLSSSLIFSLSPSLSPKYISHIRSHSHHGDLQYLEGGA